MDFENTSANTQEVAEPVEAEGANGQEVAGPDKGTQSNDDNRRYAAARRESEARLKAENDFWKGVAEKRGFKNVEEFKASLEKEDASKMNARIEEVFGVGAEDALGVINDIVRNNPDVKKAQEIISANEMKASEDAFNKELDVIKGIDPSIKSFDDVMALDTFEDMRRIYEQGGKTLSEAFKIANFDSLIASKEAKARQSTLNQINSKDHLNGNRGGNSGGVTIPAETLKMYKAMMPGKTDAEYQAHYEKYRKD